LGNVSYLEIIQHMLIYPRETQIALAYVYWLRRTCPEISVFWVHVSNAERFRHAYASIAQECHIPSCENPKANILSLVKAWLERKNSSRWLRVIDNADDTQVFFNRSAEPSNITGPNREQNLWNYIPNAATGLSWSPLGTRRQAHG